MLSSSVSKPVDKSSINTIHNTDCHLCLTERAPECEEEDGPEVVAEGARVHGGAGLEDDGGEKEEEEELGGGGGGYGGRRRVLVVILVVTVLIYAPYHAYVS